ncbi:MAG: M14 family metallopeptidase, partial [Candidatus Promineifilaceae bacterium]|nr:M14 family metallopeptidase [Candidatus Promineifilaceae bacterium]
ARFNGRGVDLNRNWSCGWSPSARWGGTAVDPGSVPFSEPETRALRDYFATLGPRSVVFWHSAIGLVAPGQCGDAGGSATLAQVYGEAAGYPVGAFTAYALSGTASDWLSERGVPAAAVELTTHKSTEFGRNLAGVLAVLELHAGEGD